MTAKTPTSFTTRAALRAMLLLATLVCAPASAQASAAPTASAAPAATAATAPRIEQALARQLATRAATARTSCPGYLRSAHRRRKGSAARRAFMRKYDACRRAAERPAAAAPATSPDPTVAQPVPGAAPQRPASPFRRYQGCRPAFEAYYRAAWFTCIAYTTVSVPIVNTGLDYTYWVSSPVYGLVPLCSDGQIRASC